MSKYTKTLSQLVNVTKPSLMSCELVTYAYLITSDLSMGERNPPCKDVSNILSSNIDCSNCRFYNGNSATLIKFIEDNSIGDSHVD